MTTVSVDKLRLAIDAWLADHDFRPVRWYTPDEWKVKGEDMGAGAVLHAVTDVSMDFCNIINHGMGEDFQDFEDLVTSYGYWFDRGFEWSIHFYEQPLEGNPKSTAGRRTSTALP